MPARSVCLVTLSLSEAGPGRFGRQVSVTDIYHTILVPVPVHTVECSVTHSLSGSHVLRNSRTPRCFLQGPVR